MPDGPGCFTQDSTCPALLRIPASAVCLRVRVCHPLRRSFPARFRFAYCRLCRSYNPGRASTPPVWATTVSLATTPVITFVFSSSAYLDVSVQRVCSFSGAARAAGSPIRTSADHRPFAPTRGFSQLVTSFFASESQGIRRSLLVTYLFLF